MRPDLPALTFTDMTYSTRRTNEKAESPVHRVERDIEAGSSVDDYAPLEVFEAVAPE
jgi:hypothetical protein